MDVLGDCGPEHKALSGQRPPLGPPLGKCRGLPPRKTRQPAHRPRVSASKRDTLSGPAHKRPPQPGGRDGVKCRAGPALHRRPAEGSGLPPNQGALRRPRGVLLLTGGHLSFLGVRGPRGPGPSPLEAFPVSTGKTPQAGQQPPRRTMKSHPTPRRPSPWPASGRHPPGQRANTRHPRARPGAGQTGRAFRAGGTPSTLGSRSRGAPTHFLDSPPFLTTGKGRQADSRGLPGAPARPPTLLLADPRPSAPGRAAGRRASPPTRPPGRPPRPSPSPPRPRGSHAGTRLCGLGPEPAAPAPKPRDRRVCPSRSAASGSPGPRARRGGKGRSRRGPGVGKEGAGAPEEEATRGEGWGPGGVQGLGGHPERGAGESRDDAPTGRTERGGREGGARRAAGPGAGGAAGVPEEGELGAPGRARAPGSRRRAGSEGVGGGSHRGAGPGLAAEGGVGGSPGEAGTRRRAPSARGPGTPAPLARGAGGRGWPGPERVGARSSGRAGAAESQRASDRRASPPTWVRPGAEPAAPPSLRASPQPRSLPGFGRHLGGPAHFRSCRGAGPGGGAWGAGRAGRVSGLREALTPP